MSRGRSLEEGGKNFNPIVCGRRSQDRTEARGWWTGDDRLDDGLKNQIKMGGRTGHLPVNLLCHIHNIAGFYYNCKVVTTSNRVQSIGRPL